MSVICSHCRCSHIECGQCGRICSITEQGLTPFGHFHVGACPNHGSIYFHCDQNRKTNAPCYIGKRLKIAAPIRIISDPIMTLTTAVMISLAFAFLIGTALGLAAASLYISKHGADNSSMHQTKESALQQLQVES